MHEQPWVFAAGCEILRSLSDESLHGRADVDGIARAAVGILSAVEAKLRHDMVIGAGAHGVGRASVRHPPAVVCA